VEHELAPTLDAIRMVRGELEGKTALIGFAGGPFTLASYAIEGGSSRNYVHTKALMYSDEAAWQLLMDKIAEMTIAYLTAQVAAGAQVVQLFDSWAGALSPDDYRRYVLPTTRRIIDTANATGAPTILFGTNTAGMLDAFASADSSVVGVDWRIDLDRAWEIVGHARPVQGNLDPLVLFAPADVVRAQVQAILRKAGGRPGHIFNLGHGILPHTPVAAVQQVVELVHAYDPTEESVR
jgi:uroporphyrinogen decarboxylase